jgi:RNA polymerase sigma-70 factor (ECF subfamily)
MTDLVWTVEQLAAVPAVSSDHLDRLVSRVAAGDRLAFRRLYAFLAVRVWHTAARALPYPGHALAVTRSTFLEVWHTAGAAAHYDARDWIEAITALRVDERRRVLGDDDQDHDGPVAESIGVRQPAPDLVDQDDRTHRELANVLGTGRATIRVAPAMFVRIEDLDRAVDAIAATTGH